MRKQNRKQGQIHHHLRSKAHTTSSHLSKKLESNEEEIVASVLLLKMLLMEEQSLRKSKFITLEKLLPSRRSLIVKTLSVITTDLY